MRNHRKVLRSALTSFLILIAVSDGSAARASDDSELDKLLQIFLQKHLLTAEEAAKVRAEEVKATDALPARASSSVSVTTPKNAAVSSPPQSAARTVDDSRRFTLPFTISGYGQVQWTSQPGGDTTFRLRRARIRLIGDIGHIGMYRLETEFVNAPSLLDAFVTLGQRPYLKFTAGQFKIPFSQESLWVSADLPMVERAQVVNKLVPGRDNGSNGRDIGADLAGSYGLTEHTGVDYAFGVFNGNGINTTAANNQKNLAARLAVRPASGLSFAADYYNGNTAATETSRDRAGAEYKYERNRLLLMGEFIRASDAGLHRHGWYDLAAWQASPKWQILFRADSYDADTSVSNNTTSIYLGGLNWQMDKHLRFQLNGGYQDKASDWRPDVLSQMQFSF